MIRRAAVRVQFRGSGLHREYIIVHQLRNGTRRSTPPHVISPPKAWLDSAGELDLRNPKDAEIVERFLGELDVSRLFPTEK